MNINTRLDKIDKQIKSKVSLGEVGGGIKMLRMFINCRRNKDYELTEEEKISREEWEQFIQEHLFFNKQRGYDLEQEKQILKGFEEGISELGGFKD
jgi:hypothetical protein